MIIRELIEELKKFDGNATVVAGVQFWECSLSTELEVAEFQDRPWLFRSRNGHDGGVTGLPEDTKSVVAIYAKDATDL